MASDYKAPLRGIFALISKLLANVLGIFVPRIKDDETRLVVTGLLDGTRRTIEALSDSNPDDKQQMREILNILMKEGPFKQGSQAEMSQRIARIPDEDVRVLLSVVNVQAWTIGDLLTDDNPANKAQMREKLRDLLRTPDGMVFLRAAFGLVFDNDQFADTASMLIIQLLLVQLGEEGNTDVAAKLLEMQQRYDNLAAFAVAV